MNWVERTHKYTDLGGRMMPVLWVKAGICGQETTIEVRKISQTKVSITIQTTCEHVQKLSEELKELEYR